VVITEFEMSENATAFPFSLGIHFVCCWLAFSGLRNTILTFTPRQRQIQCRCCADLTTTV